MKLCPRLPLAIASISTALMITTVAGGASITDASAQKNSAAPVDPGSTATKSETGGVRATLRDLLRNWLPSTDSDDEIVGGETPEAEGGTPEALDGTVIAPPEVLSKEELAHALPWRPTSFENQTGALGWNPKTFDVPDAFRTRVNFWKDIYSKYSTDQGVIHDTIYINIIYTSLDFSGISRDSSKSGSQKARARESLIKEKKKEIIARLQRLHGHKTADGLSGDDLKTWKMFENIKDPEKFNEAADKSRVRFQLGQRDKFVLGIFYSGRYLRAMEKIFRDEGLPIELTRLPFVESSFNVNARSRVGASGVWQFMRRTAKPYMKVNKDVDERNDPIKATLASSRVLKQNYMMLESWPLALTGYNHGPYGVRGIVAKTHTRDLAEIIAKYSSRTFGFASENFYACFLAALEIEKNAHKYFGDVKWSNEVESTEVKVAANIPYRTLLDLFDGNSEFAELLNPQFSSRVRSGHAPIPKGSFLRVPPSRAQLAGAAVNGKLNGSKLVAALKQMPSLSQVPVAAVPSTAVLANNSVANGGMSASVRAKVEQTGQAAQAVLPILTLSTNDAAIAKKEAKTSDKVAALSNPHEVKSLGETDHPTPNANSAALDKPSPTPENNQPAATPSLVASSSDPAPKEAASGADSVAANVGSTPTPVITPQADAPAESGDSALVKPRTHKVHRGENLSHIARQYGVAIEELQKLNHLFTSHGRAKSKIRVGQILFIPPGGDSTQTADAVPAVTPVMPPPSNTVIDSRSLPGAEPSPPLR